MSNSRTIQVISQEPYLARPLQNDGETKRGTPQRRFVHEITLNDGESLVNTGGNLSTTSVSPGAGDEFAEWVASATYSIGDLVSVPECGIFACVVGHTSSAQFTSDTSNWKLAHSGANWVAQITYLIGQVVSDEDRFWRSLTNHNGQSNRPSQDATNWTRIDSSFRGPWQGTTRYELGDYIEDTSTSKLYRATVAHTSSASFSTDRDSNWTEVSPPPGHMRATGSTASLNVGSLGQLGLDTVVNESGSGSDLANNQYVIPQDGWYDATLKFGDAGLGVATVEAEIQLAGSTLVDTLVATVLTTVYAVNLVSGVFYATAGQVVTFHAGSIGGANNSGPVTATVGRRS